MPVTNGQSMNFALGQSTTLANSILSAAATSLGAPPGVAGNAGRLVVGDGLNRVLIWNSLPTTNAAAANRVLGQYDFVSSNANNGQPMAGNSISTSQGVYSDGTRLFVADSSSNRVLIWNSIPTTNDQTADVVLGQPDFVSYLANNGGISASTLNSPHGVYSNGTRLFVSDSANHRVLIWNTIPTVNNQAADLVLGQPNFTTLTPNTGGVSAISLLTPTGIHSDGTRLFVSDTDNARVLIWNSLPTSNRQPADFALGQPNLTSNSANLAANSLSSPSSVFSSGTKLFVADSGNHRVLLWNSLPTLSGTAADHVLGQPDLNTGLSNNGVPSPDETSLNSPSFVTSDGTRLLVSDSNNNRILGWNSLPTSDGQPADFQIGQPDFGGSEPNNGGLTANSLSNPAGIFTDGSRVFISDNSNPRILIVPIPGI